MEKSNSKTDRLTDKAFSRLVFTSILGILVCVVCLCSSTFAWFTDVAPSARNEINIADECALEVTVTKDGVPLADIENGVVLEGEYLVTLSLPANTASGYCVITVGEATYYTDYLVRSEQLQTVSFTLQATSEVTATFTPHWGIYTRNSDVVNGELMLP